MTTRSHISISAQQGQAPLTAPQKKFNTLVQKIAAQRQQLASWNEATVQFHQRHAREFAPLLSQLDDASADLVRFLDAAYAQKGLSKTDRKNLAAIISEMAHDLMDGERLEAMKTLYNRYAGTDFDADEKAMNEVMKEMIGQTMGIELPEDIDMDSPDALLRMLHEKAEAEQAERERMQDHAAAEKAKHRDQHRKKSAREIKQETAEKDASQSLREVFRKLASALHPDRETDPAERARKTALMQRVNQAYASKNLLDMLQLQIEAEQIDPERINNLSAERLRHYNQVLSDQLRELQQELRETEDSFKMRYGMSPFERVTPANMMGLLREQINMVALDIQDRKHELVELADVKALKRWIKLEMQRSEEEFDPFDDMEWPTGYPR
jgi:hypothetical protein